MDTIQRMKRVAFTPKNYWKNSKIIFRYFSVFLKKMFFVREIKDYFHDKSQLEFYKKYIIAPKLIFDVGANVGRKTDTFLKLGAHVVSVEPQSKMAGNLRAKYTGNPRVTIEQCGLSSAFGEAKINISSRYNGFSSFVPNWQAGTKYDSFDVSETVPLRTLESLIEKHGLPDFCKIDVEGFEVQVLSGLQSKISLLNFEFHSDDMNSITTCLEKLKNIGFKEFNFVMFEDAHMHMNTWAPESGLLQEIQRLNKLENNVIWGDIYAR